MSRYPSAVDHFLILLVMIFTLSVLPLWAQQPPAAEDIQIDVPPTIRTIEFTGNTIVSTEDLRQAAGIKTGTLLTEPVLRTAADNIRKAYAERGYRIAITDIQFPEPGQVGTLTFQLQEVKIVEVRFVGLKKTRESVVRGVTITQPGDLYYLKNIQEDAVSLRELGVFETINPELEFRSPGEAIIVWNLEEREKFNYIDAGGSIGAGEGLVFRAGLNLANLGGRADRLRLDAFVGAIETQLGGRLTYFNPLVAPRTSLDAAAFSTFQYRFSNDLVTVTGQNIDRYYERHTGGQFFLSRPQTKDLTLTAGLRYDNVDTNNVPPQVFEGITSLDNTIFVGHLRGVRDRRNSIDYPSRGSLATTGLEAGVADLEDGGSGGIARIGAAKIWYKELGKTPEPADGEPRRQPPVLAYRALAATSVGDLPFSEQFFMGGLSTYTIRGITSLPLRGYREDRFWGKNAVAANVEYRFPLSRTFIAVGFVDAGDAWDSDYQFIDSPDISTNYRQHESFSPRFGGGVGFRYSSPFGPLLLDFAYGEEFRVHFSVGTLF